MFLSKMLKDSEWTETGEGDNDKFLTLSVSSGGWALCWSQLVLPQWHMHELVLLEWKIDFGSQRLSKFGGGQHELNHQVQQWISKWTKSF